MNSLLRILRRGRWEQQGGSESRKYEDAGRGLPGPQDVMAAALAVAHTHMPALSETASEVSVLRYELPLARPGEAA